MFDSLKKAIQQQMVLQRLDERLLIALFAPAVREGIFDPDDLSWQRSERSQDADKLIAQLLPHGVLPGDQSAAVRRFVGYLEFRQILQKAALTALHPLRTQGIK